MPIVKNSNWSIPVEFQSTMLTEVGVYPTNDLSLYTLNHEGGYLPYSPTMTCECTMQTSAKQA